MSLLELLAMRLSTERQKRKPLEVSYGQKSTLVPSLTCPSHELKHRLEVTLSLSSSSGVLLTKFLNCGGGIFLLAGFPKITCSSKSQLQLVTSVLARYCSSRFPIPVFPVPEGDS